MTQERRSGKGRGHESNPGRNVAQRSWLAVLAGLDSLRHDIIATAGIGTGSPSTDRWLQRVAYRLAQLTDEAEQLLPPTSAPGPARRPLRSPRRRRRGRGSR